MMVKVEFQTIEGEVIASLSAVASGVENMADPENVVDLDVMTIGVHTGKPVSADEDPEEWARSLPRVYRNPYLLAVVVDDDNPVKTITQTPVEIEEHHLVGV
jgi:hypothetical protein